MVPFDSHEGFNTYVFGDRSENQIVTIKSYFQLPEKCMVLHTWFIQALDCFFTGALENGYCCQGVQLRNKHKKKLKCKLISLHLMRQLMSRIGTFPQGSKWSTNQKSTCFNIQSMLLYLSFFHPGQVQNFRYLTSNATARATNTDIINMTLLTQTKGRPDWFLAIASTLHTLKLLWLNLVCITVRDSHWDLERLQNINNEVIHQKKNITRKLLVWWLYNYYMNKHCQCTNLSRVAFDNKLSFLVLDVINLWPVIT